MPDTPAVTAHPLAAEDLPAYHRLVASAFAGDHDDSVTPAPEPGRQVVGIASRELPGGVDGVLAAGLTVREDTLVLGGNRVRCGGISGLAVHPAHRGGGLFSTLLRGAVEQCVRNRQGLSMLYPSHPGIYARAGWQRIATVDRVLAPLGALAGSRPVPGRRIVPVTRENWHEVGRIYAQVAAGENAMLVREPPLFDPATMPALPYEAVLVTDEDGTPLGHMSWTRVQGRVEVPGTGAVGLEVHELLARDQDSRRALLRVLDSWSTVVACARIRLLTDDPLLELLGPGSVRPDPRPLDTVMLRVTDVATALAQRGAPAGLDGALRLTVRDPLVAGVGGSWDLRIGDGAVTSTPVRDTSADGAHPDRAHPARADLDVRTLALLIAGGRTVADARRLGHHLEADAEATRLLDALCAGPRPSVLDAF
jgi:predicted acetyltransferase